MQTEMEARASLQKEMGPADWALLEPHYESGALVIVDSDLDLIDVAVRMFKDDTAFIKQLMTELKLNKVDQTNVAQVKARAKVFSCVVVAPFVLIQA